MIDVNLCMSFRPLLLKLYADVRVLVELPGGATEEAIVNGKTLSQELLLELKAKYNIESLHSVSFADSEPRTIENEIHRSEVEPISSRHCASQDISQYYRSNWDIHEDFYARSKCIENSYVITARYCLTMKYNFRIVLYSVAEAGS